MKIRNGINAFMLLSYLSVATVCAANEPVERFLSSRGMEHASVGISVKRVSDGKDVIVYDDNRSLVPASTQKTITTATALRLLGENYRMQTRVGYRGVIEKGVLHGDLIIRGGGDPTLGSRLSLQSRDAIWEQLIPALKSSGIERIDGNVIGDETLLSEEGIQPGWLWEDMGNYYAAGIYGLNFRDNYYELILDTSQKGKQPKVKEVRPRIPDLKIHNGLLAKATSFDSAYLYGAPFSNDRFLYGAVPQQKPEFTIKGDMPAPALQTAQLALDYLQQHNIRVSGTARSGRSYLSCGVAIPVAERPLLQFSSDPLRTVIRQTNVFSNNLFAEGLLRQIGLAAGAGSAAKGIETILAYWKEQGVAVDGLFLYDGSGLSPSNKVTASFLSSLMVRMKNDPAFEASLPVAGAEGTVSSFLGNTSLKGKARLKSGTIKQVTCYTGYINGKEKYAVTVLVNNATCSNRDVRRAIEKLLVELNL